VIPSTGEPGPAPGARGYRPDIDGLRCIAVLLVLVFHFQLFGSGKAGFIGVDIFFVISGFLISSLIWRGLDAGTFSLGTFYLRRFRRLAPALAVVQLMVLGVAYFRLLPNEVSSVVQQSVFTQAYLINFYLWKSVSYFGLQAANVPLLHCWSLAVEEQFYLTYPLLLVVVHRYARRYFVWILGAVTLVSFALNVGFVTSRPWATFYLLPTRAWELCFGALLPWVQPWFASRRGWRHAAGLIGTVAVFLGIVLYSEHRPFPGFFALIPVVGAMALLLAGEGEGAWTSAILKWSPLVYVGRISYSLYLVHWPIWVFTREPFGDYGAAGRWGAFAASFVVSAVLFHFVEDPIRKGTMFVASKRFVAAYASAVLLILGIAGSSAITHGWAHRFDPAVVRLANYENDQNQSALQCEYSGPDWQRKLPACTFGEPGRAAEWLIIGDSIAWSLADAFTLVFQQRKTAGELAFRHQCMPIVGLGDSHCREFVEAALKHVVESPQIKTVVLVSIWREAFEGPFLEGADGRPLHGTERTETFRRQVTQTLQLLRDNGKSVMLWEPMPAARGSVPKTLAWAAARGTEANIGARRDQHAKEVQLISDVIAENRALLRATISPADAMCPTPVCFVQKDGIPLYADNVHPTRSSAPFFAGVIEAAIAGASAR
jgi:peptidoglycan/LPS O-acetylase OafA/YrhL